MLSITLATNQRCYFNPNPLDIPPGVGPDYLVANGAVCSVDNTGPKPDIVPNGPGTTLVTIRGAVAPGQPYITEDVEVIVTPGPPPPSFNRFEPTAEPPRDV